MYLGAWGDDWKCCLCIQTQLCIWGGSETVKQYWRIFPAPNINFFSEMTPQTKTYPEKTHYERASEVTWLHKQRLATLQIKLWKNLCLSCDSLDKCFWIVLNEIDLNSKYYVMDNVRTHTAIITNTVVFYRPERVNYAMDDLLTVHYLDNYTATNQINKDMDMKYNYIHMIQMFGVLWFFKKSNL